jgi:hypothetical protein
MVIYLFLNLKFSFVRFANPFFFVTKWQKFAQKKNTNNKGEKKEKYDLFHFIKKVLRSKFATFENFPI